MKKNEDTGTHKQILVRELHGASRALESLASVVEQSPDKTIGTHIYLTPTQESILALVAEGLSNKEIAERLSRAENTVRSHIRGTMNATGLKNRTLLTRFYLQRHRP